MASGSGGLRELGRAYRSGNLLPSNVLAASARLQRLTSHLNIFVTECTENAQSAAKQSDARMAAGSPLGPLDGIPMSFKDNFCATGLPTTCASRMLENFVSPYNATVVQKSLDNGALLVGKTNLDEFAMGSGTTDSLYGPTKNVWGNGTAYSLINRKGELLAKKENVGGDEDDDWVVAGGSSGGSAVSVAAGIVAASLGSDTGGSVRIPAAWTGVVSLKPTYGRISRHGLIPLVNSLDCPGILTRRVKDCAAVLQIIEGRDPLDSTTIDCPQWEEPNLKHVAGLKVGLPQEFFCDGMSNEVIEVWSKIADMLDRGGAEVVPVNLPHTELAIPCYSVLNPCEVASNMARYDGLEFGHRADTITSTEDLYAETRSQGFNEVVRGRILAGNYFLLKQNYEKYYLQALKVRRLILEDYLATWRDGVDLLVTPVTLTDAPTFSDFSSSDNRAQTAVQDFCTQPINLAGLPALTLPVSLSNRQLPLAVQLVGPSLKEHLLLGVAAWLEDQLDFPTLLVSDRQTSSSSSENHIVKEHMQS